VKNPERFLFHSDSEKDKNRGVFERLLKSTMGQHFNFHKSTQQHLNQCNALEFTSFQLDPAETEMM